MKILAVGDTHARTKRICEYYKLTDEIIRIAKKQKPDIIVLLGDDLHNHSIVHSIQLKAVTELIMQLSEIAHVYKIIGNHEIISPQNFLEEDHHFHSFKCVKNVTIVDKPVVRDNLLFVPFVPQRRFNEAIKNIDLNNIRIIFAHQEFVGVKTNGDHESSCGDSYDIENPTIVSGHIHLKQSFNNIHYVGAPVQTTFADEIERYVAIIDDFDIQYIPVENITKYITHEINLKEELPNKIDYNKDDRNRIIIKGSLTEYKTFRSSKLFKELTNNNFIITPKINNEHINLKKTKVKTFQEIISEQLTDDIKDLWNSINQS